MNEKVAIQALGRALQDALGFLSAWQHHLDDQGRDLAAAEVGRVHSDLTLTPPSNTSRRKARSTRRPARHRKQPCIYAGVGLSRAGGWPAAA